MHGRHRLQRASRGHQEVGEGKEGHGGEGGRRERHFTAALTYFYIFDRQRCAHHRGNSWPADGLAAEEGDAP